MTEPILQAIDVQKKYGQQGSENILNGISLSVCQGDFLVIMGPSGAGKSTLLYALSGMDAPDGGMIRYRTQEMTRLKEKQMAVLRAKEFGFVFQQTHLVSNLTLRENITVAGYVSGRKDAESAADELLLEMHIENLKDRLPNQISGGEAQRCAIARAMVSEPGILFADEPTGALNKKNTEDILDLLTKLNQRGQTILMVTHDKWAALRANRILYLEDGQILDEIKLPYFSPEEKQIREKQIDAWLASHAW